MNNPFIPALKYHWLTPFYDFIIKIVVPEKGIRLKILEAADLKGFERVLDYGCGTGTQLILAKNIYPNLRIGGFDIDKNILKIANQKIRKAEIVIPLLQDLDINSKYDVILCSWVYHHLSFEEKILATKKIKSMLAPNGVFILADWGPPTSLLSKAAFFMLQILDNFTTTEDNRLGLIDEILQNQVFAKVENVCIRSTFLGSFYIWKIIL